MPPYFDHLADLTGEDESRLEQIFEAFEVAWNEAPRPRIADYLPGEGGLRRAALVELVYIDQEYAIRSDSPADIEDYLTPFPELAYDPEIVVEMVARDFRLRRRHGDDGLSAEGYLARFPQWRDRIDARLKAEAVGTDHPPASVEKTPSALPDVENPRYDDLKFHARGGLGDVFRARDVELSREVALKRIRLKFASESKVRRRFLREARLTARLNHPGVVPIHGLIWDRHDEPWYVMRFVEGKTLALATEEYHQSLLTNTRPDDQPLAFRKLLARYVAVCDTIAFAHSRDVVHRDLKPSNVILGDYGETIVLDWGLATSALDGQDDRPSPSSPSAWHLDGTAEPVTQAGQVLGTPAFMSPEQAQGLPAMNLPASDVYGLGAILYMVLIGRPPFGPEVWQTLQEKIVRGNYPTPRQVKPDVPRPLEAICRKAMALDPGDRYETAGDLARDVERWTAGEPVSAWQEPWTLQAQRWARKHRTGLTTAASAATVAALVLIAIGGLKVAQRSRTDASARTTFAQAETLAAEARTSGDPALFEQAIARGDVTRKGLESGNGSSNLLRDVEAWLITLRADYDRRRAILDAEEKDRRVVAAVEEARLRGANVTSRGFDTVAKHEAYLSAFRRYGIDVATLSIEDAARRIRSSSVSDDLITALDDWVTNRSANVPNARLSEIARAAESDPERAAVRDAIDRKDEAFLKKLMSKKESWGELGPKLRGMFPALRRLNPAAYLPLLEAICREHPSDFWLNFGLANAYVNARPPRISDSITYYRVAIALRPESAGVRFNLGLDFLAVGKYDDAAAAFRDAICLKPDYHESYTGLGDALSEKGDQPGAIAAYHEAIRHKPDFVAAHTNLGLALLNQGDPAAAAAEFRKSIHINPKDALAHNCLGDALSGMGEPTGALAEYREAVRLNPDLVEAWSNIGMALSAERDHEGALVAYSQAIRHRPDDAEGYCNLGQVQLNLGRFQDALKSLEKGHQLGSKTTNWSQPSAQWVSDCKRLIELDQKLPAILKREVSPVDADERLILADVCLKKLMYAGAAHFYAEAFAERPALADDPATGSRYNAASMASLAGSGQGKDDPPPDEPARAKLREKALGWLRADLAAWAKVLDGGSEPARKQKVAQQLVHWKQDSDLAGIRDDAALAKLSEDEQKAFRSLWSDVETLRKRAAE